LHKILSHGFLSDAILQYLGGVRTPLAKVIVYVNDRHFGPPSPPFQLRQATRHRYRLPQKLMAIGKLEVVKKIDEEHSL
jgi:hypothetical protein